MFTVFAKRIFVLQSASPCNAATVCFSYRLNGLTMLSSKVADHFCVSVYVVAFQETNTGTLRPHPHFLCYEHSIWTGDGP